MKTKWTDEALQDLERVYEFRAMVNKQSAKRLAQSLKDASKDLMNNPHIGGRLEEYGPREVRRLIVGSYEMRYEIQGEMIAIVRLWHTREDREKRRA